MRRDGVRRRAAGAVPLPRRPALSVGTFWIVKVVFRALLAAAAALLVLLPSFIRVLTAPDHRPRPAAVGSDLLIHVIPQSAGSVPDPVAGLRLLLRLPVRPAVPQRPGLGRLRPGLGGPSGRGVGAVGAGRRPELLAGVGPPLLLLASTPLLLRPWAAGRIVSWTTVSRLAPFVVLAVLGPPRAVVSGVGDPGRRPEVRRRRVPGEPAEAGRQPGGRPGARRLHPVRRFAGEDRRRAAGPSGGRRAWGAAKAVSIRYARLIAALHYGWLAADADLDDYLSRLGDDEWRTELAEAAGLPTGMADDPRLLTAADLHDCRSRYRRLRWPSSWR